MRRLVRNSKGQAAVETLFSIPIFLILFVIGFELFGITWNAQYAIATSRYNTMAKVKHAPCSDNGDWKGNPPGQIASEASDSSVLSGDQSPYMQTFAQERRITAHSYVVCK